MTSETRRRSFIKALIYRPLNILCDTGAVYLLTHKIELTASVVVVTNVSSTLLYYGYERGWNLWRWGRR